MADQDDVDQSIDKHVLRIRLVIWTVGTIGAGVPPIVAAPLASLANSNQLPGWGDICKGGEFFVVGMVVVIASQCELLLTLFKDLTIRQRASVLALLLGGSVMILGLLFAFVAALVRRDSGFDPGFFTELMSPAAWLLACWFAVYCVKIAGGLK